MWSTHTDRHCLRAWQMGSECGTSDWQCQRRSEAAAAEAEERGRGPADRRPGRAAAARGDPQGRLAFSKLCIISASEIKEKWI